MRVFDLDGQRFDRRLGVETGGTAEPTTLNVPAGDPAEGFLYVATSPRLARWWLAALPHETREFTFIDMGSGKGRVLLLAAAHGFGRTIGVEFATELHDVAVENARAARAHGLEIEPFLGDAATFEFPAEPLVVHFNNPFSEQVMHRVLANLNESYGSRPRPLIVVYQQLTSEGKKHRTTNIELLERTTYLSGRRLTTQGWLDRRLLRGYTVAVLESPEAAALAPSRTR